MSNEKLEKAWQKRLSLRAEGTKLKSKGDKLWDEGKNLRLKSDHLEANVLLFKSRGNILFAKGSQIKAEGDTLWAEAIIQAYGNIALKWENCNAKGNYECHLATGEVFKP